MNKILLSMALIIGISNSLFATTYSESEGNWKSKNNKCTQNAETITPLQNISTTGTHYLTGKAYKNSNLDFFKFKIGANGTLKIDGSTTNNRAYHLKIGESCSGNSNLNSVIYGDKTRKNHNVSSFKVNAGDNVYLRIYESGSNNHDDYKIKFNFTADAINNLPVLSDQTTSIAENATNNTLVIDLNATDTDNDPLTYSIVGGNTEGIFAINSSTGEITIADNTNLNYNTATSHTLNIEVSDGKNITSANVTVNVTDTENPPVATDTSFSINSNLSNGDSVGTFTATDKDGDIISYSIISGNNLGVFAINSSTGEITIADNTNLSETTYNLQIQSSSNGDNITNNVSITASATVVYNETGTSGDASYDPENTEIITPLNNITKPITVLVDGSIASDNPDYDPYKFTVGKDGTVKIDSYSLDNPETEFYFWVDSQCGSDNIYNFTQASTHDVPLINVKAGDTIYITAADFPTKDYEIKIKYQPDVEYVTDGSGAGPVNGVNIGYNEISVSNTDKTGTIYLVDDDKQQCPTAPYSTMEEALTDIKSNNGGTMVLCDGAYNTPSTLNGFDVTGYINNLTITSNSSRDKTIINGELSIRNINNFTLSHVTLESDTKSMNFSNINGMHINDIRAHSKFGTLYSERTDGGFTIENSEFNSLQGNGIEMAGVPPMASLINNVKVGIGKGKDEQNGGNGILVSTDDTTISNSSIYSHKSGIQAINAPKTKIVNTEIYNNTTNAILVKNSDNTKIKNSRYISNSLYGIEVYGSQNLKITDSMLEALSAETIFLSDSNGAYIQNNCMVTNTQVYDVEILEDMNIATFDNGIKGNFYSKADYIDNNGDGINDYPFSIVVNNNQIYKDNFPQLKCNLAPLDNTNANMYLEQMTDLNPAENIVADNAIFGTQTQLMAYTKNSASASSGDVNQKINLLIIADESGSMYDSRFSGVVTLEDGTVTTKLQVTEDAIKLLISTYSKIADINYNIIGFASDIVQYTDWQPETVAVPDLQEGGATNYYAALSKAMDTALDKNNLPTAEKTYVYFMSDGEVTIDESEFNDPDFQQTWYDSVVNNPDVYKSYVYGILFGGPDLNTVAIEEEGYKTPDPIIIQTADDIASSLLANLSSVIEYSLIDDYNGAYGINKQTGEVYVKDSTKLDATVTTDTYVTVKAVDTINNLTTQSDFLIKLVKGEDQNVNTISCDMFTDAVQTRKTNCTSTEGIIWSGVSEIKNNPDTSLNTCNIDIPKWVSDKIKTCETGQCEISTTEAKSVSMLYSNPPEIATALSNPTNSTNEYYIYSGQNKTSSLNEYNYIQNDNGNFTVNATDTIKINSLKVSSLTNTRLKVSKESNLLIGAVSVSNGGVANNITAIDNLFDVSVKSYLISGDNNTLNIVSSNSITFEKLITGQGAKIDLSSKVINIDQLEITNSGNGDGTINISADYVNINSIKLGDKVTLNIQPLNNNEVIFRVNDITMSSTSGLILSSGSYYINNKFDITSQSNGRSIRALDDKQRINIFLNNDLLIGNNQSLNVLNGTTSNPYGDLPATKFVVYVNGDFQTGDSKTIINALIYAEGNAIIRTNAKMKGAISATDSIELQNSSELVYDQEIITEGYGACTVVANPKPEVSIFSAWDTTKPKTDRVILQKKVGEPFDLNIASLTADNSGTENIEFNIWLEDVATGNKLSPIKHFVQQIDAISVESFKISSGAYREVKPTFEICSDYDNTTKKYSIYDFNSCSSTCNYDLEETNGAPCFRKVQQEEAFSVVPDNLKVEIFNKTDDTPLDNKTDKTGGTTYVSGENFKVKVSALDIDGNIITNWNEPFTISTKKAFTGMIEDGNFVEDKTTLADTNEKMIMKNGVLEFEGYFDEVGIIEMKIDDNTDFGSVDYDANNPTGHYITNNSETFGRFIPANFNVEDINLKSVKGNNEISNALGCNYNYLNETGKNLSTYGYGITISAVNANGDLTKNYDGDFAKSTNFYMNVNWKNVGPNNGSGSTVVGTTINDTDWKEGVYSTPSNINIEANVDILQNIGVDRKTTMEPFSVALTNENNLYTSNFTATDGEVNSILDSGNRSFDVSLTQTPTLYYVYGRINPINSISAENGDATVQVYYEIYANTQKAILETALNNHALKESVNNAKWWRNENHNTCDKKQADDFIITFNTANTTVSNIDLTNNDRDILTIHNGTLNRPFDTIGTIDLGVSDDTFLLHYPYSNKKEVRFSVKFIGNAITNVTKTDTIKNSGSTTANQYRFIR